MRKVFSFFSYILYLLIIFAFTTITYLLSFHDPLTLLFTLSFYFPLMPNACSAPGCTSNYYPDGRVHIFRIPDNSPALKQAWIRALHSEDIDRLKVFNVCIKCSCKNMWGIFIRLPVEMVLSMYLVINLI